MKILIKILVREHQQRVADHYERLRSKSREENGDCMENSFTARMPDLRFENHNVSRLYAFYAIGYLETQGESQSPSIVNITPNKT